MMQMLLMNTSLRLRSRANALSDSVPLFHRRLLCSATGSCFTQRGEAFLHIPATRWALETMFPEPDKGCVLTFWRIEEPNDGVAISALVYTWHPKSVVVVRSSGAGDFR